MFSDIVMVHRKQAHGFTADSQWLLWQTCLRQVAFGPAGALSSIELLPGDEILRGDQAYKTCLELICGLHSPLVGETEVLGQFKNAADLWEIPETPFGFEMRRFLRSAFEDSKKVRTLHLGDLGSQSYGSLLRRELKNEKEIHIVGGGHLTGEILPWLCKDGISVQVHVRNVERAVEQLDRVVAGIDLKQLTSACSEAANGTLILSAPVTAEWVSSWLAKNPTRFNLIVDLRGESASDPLCDTHGKVLNLAQIMSRISANQDLIEARKRQALAAVQDAVEIRDRAIEYRPFGWEDVCA